MSIYLLAAVGLLMFLIGLAIGLGLGMAVWADFMESDFNYNKKNE